MILHGNMSYSKAQTGLEQELEDFVLQNVEYFFGESCIVLPKSLISAADGTGTIPDAVVLNIDSREWFVVEVELGHHAVWDHIILQISKQFVASLQNHNKQKLISLAIQMVREKVELRQIFLDNEIAELDIIPTVQQIFSKPPIIAIPIDQVPEDLKLWAAAMVKTRVDFWIIEKYVNELGEILYNVSDNAAPDISTSQNGRVIEQPRGSEWYTWLLQKRYINIGETLTMKYKGHTFSGIVRELGIEITNGEIKSVSGSAIHYIKTIKPNAKTVNGYTKWRNSSNESLDDMAKRYAPTTDPLESESTEESSSQ